MFLSSSYKSVCHPRYVVISSPPRTMAAQTKWTPVALHVAQTLIESSLAINDNKTRLTEYRAKIAADMSQTPVLIEDSVLLDHILALPSNIPLPRSPERKKSPFADLERADGTMPEAQVSALFVRVIFMFCPS